MLFVFWQLISWLLYLLLSYNYEHHPTRRAAFKTLLILRLGDAAFLGGILLAYSLYGTLEFPLFMALIFHADGLVFRLVAHPFPHGVPAFWESKPQLDSP